MMKIEPNGEICNVRTVSFEFEFLENKFQPVNFPEIISAKSFLDLGGRPKDGREDYLAFPAAHSFVCKSVYTCKRPIHILICVGAQIATKLFLPPNELVPVQFDINALQAFRFDYVNSKPEPGDVIGIQGEYRTPVH